VAGGGEARAGDNEFGAVALEIGAQSGRNFLVHGGAGLNAARPGKRSVQRHPADHGAREEVAAVGGGAFAEAEQEGLAEVADHLVGVHYAP
jgi:hypothetical protein